MSNSYESVKEDAGYLALGTGTYIGLVWIFLCYPAMIIGMCVSKIIYGTIPEGVTHDGERSAYFLIALGVMIVCSFIIYILALCEKWLILLVLYALTLWPFLCIIGYYSGPAEGPLPLDFWPLW
jgi:hypothetical protein